MWRTWHKFWSSPTVSRVYFETKIANLYLCEIITFNKFCASPLKCYMRINKQLIILVYNDVKNLKWILSCCKCVHSVTSVKDPKRLSLRDNHIWYIFLQLQRMLSADNKQHINHLYNDVNHSGFIYNLMQSNKVCIFKKFRKALSQYFWQTC